MADAHRDHAALMRRRSAKARPAVSLDETPREDELPPRSASPMTTESGAGICEHGDSRDDQRESRRAFATAADGVCATRSAWLLNGRSGEKLGVTENTLKARLWRARHQLAERLGRRLRRMKDGMTRGMGDPSAATAEDEVKDVKKVKEEGPAETLAPFF